MLFVSFRSVLSIAAVAAATLFLGSSLVSAEDASDVKRTKYDFKQLSLQIPESWKTVDVDGRMRIGQFEVPAADGDKAPGEYVIFHFGAGGGGDVKANVSRWVKQFEDEGRTSRVFTGECKQGKYTLVELSGTYKKSIGPPIQMKTKSLPDWRMMGLIVEAEGGPYFIKFDGPKATVEKAAADFRAAFGGDASKEKEEKEGKEVKSDS
jgi:gluconolactonase